MNIKSTIVSLFVLIATFSLSAQTVQNGVLTIPDGTTEIKYKAYTNSDIRKVVIPVSVTKIGDWAFADCANLTEIVIPSTVTTFGKGIVNNCPNLTAIRVDKYSEAHTYFSADKRMIFTNNKPKQTKEQWIATAKKDVVDDDNLIILEGTKEIKNKAYTNSCIRKVAIPVSVTKIGDWAFADCANLAEIVIPSTVTTFGKGIVNNCPNLTAIRVDKYSEAHAYFNADSRLAFTKNKPVQSKEQWIASSKYSIFDDGILYICHDKTKTEYGQYKDNAAITDIRFPETLKTIGQLSFMNDSGLKRIVIPRTVEVISDWAFAKCANLEEVVIEEGVAEIRDCAFYECPKLKSITVPKSVRKITNENSMFWGNNDSKIFRCYAGSEAYRLAKKNGYKIDILGIDEQNADSITELVFSSNETIKPIDVECPNLKRILVSNVGKIPAGAFQKCHVDKIDLAKQIVSIGDKAFNVKSKIRVSRGSYAEQWALKNGYYLCEAFADLSTYSKDKSLKVDENFERILCNSDTPYDIAKYKFNVSRPLMLDISDGSLRLTSYMLYPCQNVTVKKKNSDGSKTDVAKYSNIQPLARYVVLTNADKNATYTVEADDKFYKSLNNIGVYWDVTFTTITENNFGEFLMLRAPQCREWINWITQIAYIMGNSKFKDLFQSSKYFTGDKDLLKSLTYDELNSGYLPKSDKIIYLTDEELKELYINITEHDFQLGTLSVNPLAAGRGAMNGTLLGIRETLVVDQYNNTVGFLCFAHEMMHNMGYYHDSNLCGNTATGVVFQNEFETLVKEFKAMKCIPYDDETILATKLYWYDDYYFYAESKNKVE